MAAPTFCSLKLGPGGAEWTKTSDALANFQSEMKTDAFKALTTHDRRDKMRELSDSRFFSVRDDDSYTMRDNLDDPTNGMRRFSITRDMMDGPGRIEKVLDANLAAGFGGARSFGGAGADSQRFQKEAFALQMNGLLARDGSDFPDWRDDQAIAKFFAKIHDMATAEARSPGRTRNFNRVIDSAPSIYLFTELLKRSETLIREEFTELWARRIFPVNNLNTFMPQWQYERYAQRGVLPQVVDIEQLPSEAPRSSEIRVPVLCALIFFSHSASWTNLELMRYAEAVSNGATSLNLSQERIDLSVRMMNEMEDLYAFFGDKTTNMRGLFSPTAETGIERITGGPKFASGNAEIDRQILTTTVKTILANTEQILAPNTIMLGTQAWLYVNDKRYGDLSTGNNQTVLEAAMATLSKFGIQEVMWVPEVGNSAPQVARLKAQGIPDPEATRLGGGIGVAGQEEMVVLKRDPKVLELIVAKQRITYPARETRTDRIEVRQLQGTGAMAFYQPAAIKIVTDVI